jgi:hypothetical protein
MLRKKLEPAHSGGYLRVRAFVFLTKGDRTSGVEGTHQVLADTGEISVSVFKFLSDTQTGELPHRLNMRPTARFGAVRRLAACCLPARGTAVTLPAHRPRHPLRASPVRLVPE